MSTLPDLQDAVRRIHGVASAFIRWPDPEGPAMLRVEFTDGADTQRVGEEVVRTLVDVGQVDLATLQVGRGAEEVQPARPVFTGMVLDRVDDELEVEVTLEYHAATFRGTARGDVTQVDELALVASAAVDAVMGIRPDGHHLRTVQRHHVQGASDVVTVLLDHDASWQPSLVGTALVERDAREATVRATLDALNRVWTFADPSPASNPALIG
ncbi:hypothetical protein [Euzebya sp.]|uniref:hypothetical protein n=1 Tax=Euzebya sp. TaxID=1971409 RepID=UPI003511ABCC